MDTIADLAELGATVAIACFALWIFYKMQERYMAEMCRKLNQILRILQRRNGDDED